MARVRHRKLRVLRLATILFIVCVILLGATSVVQALRSGEEEQMVTVTVAQGDTLWTLADRFGPQHMDPRLVVEAILAANGLEDVNIYPGQVLKIPRG